LIAASGVLGNDLIEAIPVQISHLSAQVVGRGRVEPGQLESASHAVHYGHTPEQFSPARVEHGYEAHVAGPQRHKPKLLNRNLLATVAYIKGVHKALNVLQPWRGRAERVFFTGGPGKAADPPPPPSAFPPSHPQRAPWPTAAQ